MLFNEEMITKSLEQFVEQTKKKHSIKGDTKEIAQMILEELESQARKTGKTSVGVGMSDEDLEHAIIKAPAELPKWREKKKKTETKAVAQPKPTKTDKQPSKKETARKHLETDLKIKQNSNGAIEMSLFDF